MLHRHSRVRITAAAIALICLLAALASTAGAERPNVDVIFDYLVGEMELNSAAACGVLANIEKESGFRNDIYGDGGTSYGICQWHDFSEGSGRFTNLRNYCDENGLDWQTLDGQLKFLYYELSSSSWYSKTLNYLRSVDNTDQGAYDAAYYWCYYFEIPYQKEIQSVSRGELARDKYWPLYGNGDYVSDKPFEIWKVGEDRLNVRTGPDTTYPVSATLSPGDEVRVTDIKLSGNTFWAKGPLGWCVLAGLEYVSGELYTVKYETNCAVSVPGAKVRFRGAYNLASADSLVKYGYVFLGWELWGEVREPGYAAMVTDDLDVVGVWRRDASVALLRGDSNCDGKVNAKDVTALMKYNIGADVGILPVTSDVNCDMKLNAKDVTTLMKYLIGAYTLAEQVTPAEEAAWN